MDTETNTHTDDARRGRVNTAAAEIYEGFFVPALFGQFPARVLDHAGVHAGDRVLDVGCGTGVAARTALDVVGPHGQVVGVDPNAGMLAVAERVAPMIEWRIGVAEELPAPDRGFDHVVSQFAAMFFDDRAKALAEMARATTDGGTITLATWCALDRTPGYEAMVDLVSDELGDGPADALRAPFVLGEPGDVRRLLDQIGPDIQVDELDGTARFASIADWVHTDVRGWTLSDLVDDEAEAALTNRARRDLAEFVQPDGTVRFAAPALVGTVTVER